MKGIRICHPQNMALWHKDYFELEATENQLMQEEFCASPCLPKSRAFSNHLTLYQEEKREQSYHQIQGVDTKMSLHKQTLLK